MNKSKPRRRSENAVASIGTDTPPGTYVMKVTVTDRVGKGTKVVEREFVVEPARLGLVRIGLSYSPSLWQGTSMPSRSAALPNLLDAPCTRQVRFSSGVCDSVTGVRTSRGGRPR